MVIRSNTLDYLFLQDGSDGNPGTPGANGKTLYTWVKYSQNSDGSNMTDNPTGAKYIGIAYNKESQSESVVASDYSWTKILGDNGQDAYTVILQNENVSFSVNQSNIPLSTQTHTCEITVMQGTIVRTNFTIGEIVSEPGIVVTSSGDTITLSVAQSNAISNDSGSIVIPIIIDGNQINKTITYSLSKAGIDGKTGISIIDVTVQYYLSSSATSLSGGSWDSNIPTWENGKYIWSKTVTSFSNETSTETNPVCITGGKGETGQTGKGIESIIPEYAISNSKTTAPSTNSSSWTQDPPTWSTGKYIWTRNKIVYVHPDSVEYTIPICDSTWETVSDILEPQIYETNTHISNVELKVDQHTKDILLKADQHDIEEAINTYDGSTVKNIRDQVSQINVEVGEITSQVSDVKTEVEKKADGTTVQQLTDRVSKSEQTAEEFKQTVETTFDKKQDLPRASIRYIRDWLKGNSVNMGNHWVECQVIANNENISYGITPTCLDSSGETFVPTISDDTLSLEIYTDGDYSSSPYISGGNSLQCLQLDLGIVRKDIDTIKVWHYYADSRSYNHKLQVSEDGTDWITLFDSDMQGTYEESSDGKLYYINQSSIQKEFSEIRQTSNEIEASVKDLKENVGASIQEVSDRISIKVEQLNNDIANLNLTNEDTDEKIEKIRSELQVSIDSISSLVSSIEENVEYISQMQQLADGWKFLFKQIQMYQGSDVPEVETFTKIDANGVTVDKDGSIVMMTAGFTSDMNGDGVEEIYNPGIVGFYNGQPVFELHEDKTITERLYASKGLNLYKMKIIPVELSQNSITKKGLAFINASGDS